MMDNGAYEKYIQANPDSYKPLSTYDYIDQYVHTLSTGELVVSVVLVALGVLAIYKIFTKRKNKPDDHTLD